MGKVDDEIGSHALTVDPPPGTLDPVDASRRAVPVALAGLFAGVLVALVVWLVVRPGAAAEPLATAATQAVTTTTAVTPTTAPVWVNVHETRLGPSVVIPASLEMEGEWLVFTYDVVNVAPGPDAHLGLAAPARWTLDTGDGEVSSESAGPTSRAVRFRVGSGFAPEQVEGIRVDSYRVASPVEWPLPLDPTSIDPMTIGPELTFRLVTIIEQTANSLVIIEVDSGGAPIDMLAVLGRGRDWASSSFSMLGTPRWTLDFRGAELPDRLPLVVRGVAWIEIERTASVDLSGVIE